jgi:hypothetical protein
MNETVIAHFTGEIEVSGILRFAVAIPNASFIVHEEYHHLLPQLVQSFPRDWTYLFFIQNQRELLDMAGIVPLYVDGYSRELTIRISNFTIMYDGYGSAVDLVYVSYVVAYM